MKDLIEAINYIGVPTSIAIAVIGLFVVAQVVGEVVELCGKVVPEFLKVRKTFARRKSEKEETKQMIMDCKNALSEFNKHYGKDNITQRNDWMNQVNDSMKNNDILIQALDGKVDKILEANGNLKTQLEQVKENVLDNEADRLRSELFDCGNRCRRHIRLHPEEMEHIRAVYKKYSDVLHQNGSGETEFKFITDYYNHQDFPTYHQPNN